MFGLIGFLLCVGPVSFFFLKFYFLKRNEFYKLYAYEQLIMLFNYMRMNTDV